MEMYYLNEICFKGLNEFENILTINFFSRTRILFLSAVNFSLGSKENSWLHATSIDAEC